MDDLDNTTIDEGGTQTFPLNGAAYEIDLSVSNVEKLHDALAPFTDAGRRVGRALSAKATRGQKRSSDDLKTIRAWARDNGFKVSDRGRIAADIIAAYPGA